MISSGRIQLQNMIDWPYLFLVSFSPSTHCDMLLIRLSGSSNRSRKRRVPGREAGSGSHRLPRQESSSSPRNK